MGSENFIEFAVQQVWFDPDAGESFNVTAVYGTDKDHSRYQAQDA